MKAHSQPVDDQPVDEDQPPFLRRSQRLRQQQQEAADSASSSDSASDGGLPSDVRRLSRPHKWRPTREQLISSHPSSAALARAAAERAGSVDHLGRQYFDTSLSAGEYMRHRLGSPPNDVPGRGEPTLNDVYRAEPPPPGPPSRPSWTNPRTGRSVLLQGVISQSVAAAAAACIPPSVIPNTASASAAEIQHQMSMCQQLDDFYFPVKGHGKNGVRVRVNGTTMQQPRRASWSVRLGGVQTLADGTRAQELYAYSQSYRPPEDWRARPMPWPVFNL